VAEAIRSVSEQRRKWTFFFPGNGAEIPFNQTFYVIIFFFFMARQPLVGQSLLIIEAS
jgi:hypothetical protein